MTPFTSLCQMETAASSEAMAIFAPSPVLGAVDELGR